mmetsp:Transcript_6778/g.11861  ORF Transcript_6778/g.11861 Transcript_6778/m.11861 type:complete len:706 (+) Transcript_6778:147-2264(+)
MKIHSSALSIVLGTCAFSSSTTAFLHSPPRTSILSIRRNRDTNPQKKTSLSESEDETPSLISQLGFYPSDDETTLAERLKNVQAEWDNVKKEGIGNFFSDELDAAEKIIQGNADNAERGAADVIEKGESEDYLLKDGFHGMVEGGKKLASEMMEVRQEFDELKAAKIVEEAAEGVVSTTVLVEKDMEKVVENVVSSLREAEEAVQAAIAAIASKDGLTDAAKSELTEKLESKALNIEESIKVADSVAKTAKQIAVEDEKVMSELEKTGDRLSDAIDATESLTETLKGTEGGAAVDAVSNTVDQAAAIVKEDLSAAESIADAVGQKVVMEADAVMAMDEKAAGSAKAVRAAKSSIEGSTGGDSESLTDALTKDAQDIKIDEDTAEKLAEAIQKDAVNDEEALEVLERSSSEVNSLIDAVDSAVDKAEDVTTGEASAGSVTEAVDKIKDEVKEVEESLSDVEEAAEKCEDCNVKEFTEAEAKSSSASVEEEVVVEKEEEVEVESKQSEVEEVEETEGADEPEEEEKDEAVSESKSEVEDEGEEESAEKEEPKADSESKVEDEAEKEQDVEVKAESSSEVEGEKDESLAQSESSGAGDDSTTIASADHDGESLGDAVSSTADGAAHHTSDSVTDAVEMATKSISGDDLADAIASANPPEGLGNVVASAGSVASEIGESISSSDTVHDIATSTTEALTEVVAVVSSIFL